MDVSPAMLFVLFLHVLSADDISLEENEYSHVLNTFGADKNAETEFHVRSRRQTGTGSENEYYVTQCGYDNTQRPDGPSIQVLGRSLQFQQATLIASKLVHLMVRFMPRPLFEKIAEVNKIGLYSSSAFPDTVFQEDFQDRPNVCNGRCGSQFQNGEVVDCSAWCTTTDYPYQSVPYPSNYLWAYGNFSVLYVVETNIACQGFNPILSENLLVREFGFMMMSRIFDSETLARIETAYNTAVTNATWEEMKNKYEYFIMGTLAWFNGAQTSAKLKGMSCLGSFGNDGLPLCSDSFGQRQFIKQNDLDLYKILNFVYNNNREYVNAETSVCPEF